jgi:hypothetical protein
MWPTSEPANQPASVRELNCHSSPPSTVDESLPRRRAALGGRLGGRPWCVLVIPSNPKKLSVPELATRYRICAPCAPRIEILHGSGKRVTLFSA